MTRPRPTCQPNGPAPLSTDRATFSLSSATERDCDELQRLAALDSAEPLTGDVLLGRVNGELRAALSVDDGRVVANPFCHTAQLVALLRTWKYSY